MNRKQYRALKAKERVKAREFDMMKDAKRLQRELERIKAVQAIELKANELAMIAAGRSGT